MTTSGVDTLSFTRDQIIIKALKKCGRLGEGQTASATMINDAADDLNAMIKGWQADGVKLWTYEEYVLLLNPDQAKYSLGPSGDNFIVADDLISTTLSADGAAGANTITVESVSTIANTFNIVILQDDGGMFSTTVNGAPAGSVITLNDALTSQCSAGNTVWAFQTKGARPLKVSQARIQTSSTSEIEMTELGREDYFRIPNKKAEGTPIQYHYNPTLGAGMFYCWPLTATGTMYINLTGYRPLQVFTAADQTFDGPEETYQALFWNLAAEIAPEYGVDDATFQKIQAKADMWLAKVESFDVEDSSLIFMPDFR